MARSCGVQARVVVYPVRNAGSASSAQPAAQRDASPQVGASGARLCLLMGQMGLLGPLGPLGPLGVPRYMLSRAVVFPVRSAQAACRREKVLI